LSRLLGEVRASGVHGFCTLEYAIKVSSRIVTLTLVCFSFALTGCSGFEGASFPAVSAQVYPGALHGSVFGGHSPIIGSEVYVFQVGSGYNGAPTNEMTTGEQGTDPTHGKYVLTGSDGAFNVTNDYSCAAGEPVYLATVGGTSSTTAALIDITGSSVTKSGTIYTITFAVGNSLATGNTVSFASGAFSAAGYTFLNGTTQTVTAATSSTFSIATTTAVTTTGATGYVLTGGAPNPAIFNLAVLGLCPNESGEFANTLSFVYINEVSTVAAANALAGFGTGPYTLGAPSTNLTGIKNAANNAGQLYNINAGGRALATTSYLGSGNGTVPQTTLDTLGNILAACVDSANTVNSATAPTETGASEACSMLFENATSNGVPFGDSGAGIVPTDIATAAFNIANNPSGASAYSSIVMENLFAVQGSGTSPYSPDLSSAPKDFTIAITYNDIAAPGSIAIDASGNAFVPTNSTSGYVTKLSPLGKVLDTSATGGSGFNSIAIDPSGNVFVTAKNSGELYEYSNSLAAVTGSPWGSTKLNAPTSVAIDSTGYVYVTDGGSGTSIVQKFNNAGSLDASITNSCLRSVTQIALDPSDDIWAISSLEDTACRISNAGTTTVFNAISSDDAPGNVAIDSNSVGWIPASSISALVTFTSTGSPNVIGGGGLSSPTWVAIDGGDNVWVTNADSSYALSEFNNAGTAITGTSGYQSGKLDNPSSIAIDGSGDVWIPNASASTVTEIIGVAAPTVTPLSALKPGVLP
jgi:hypothetical protein